MKTILALVFLFGVLNAKESEAEKLCNVEIKKEIINISLVEEQCLKTANFFEAKENFEYASWYYLLSKQFQKNLDYVKLTFPTPKATNN